MVTTLPLQWTSYSVPCPALLGTDVPKEEGDVGRPSSLLGRPTVHPASAKPSGHKALQLLLPHHSSSSLLSPTTTFVSMHSLKTVLLEPPMGFGNLFLGRVPMSFTLCLLQLAQTCSGCLHPVALPGTAKIVSLLTMDMFKKPLTTPYQEKLLIFWWQQLGRE